MIIAFPILLIVAMVIASRSSARLLGSSDGRWFPAWTLAGAAVTFSFLTGLSIGLFVLPFAAAVLWWVARRAPHLVDALGFVVGIGLVLLLVGFLNRDGDGIDPLPWLLCGLGLSGLALACHVVLRHRALRRSARDRPA